MIMVTELPREWRSSRFQHYQLSGWVTATTFVRNPLMRPTPNDRLWCALARARAREALLGGGQVFRETLGCSHRSGTESMFFLEFWETLGGPPSLLWTRRRWGCGPPSWDVALVQ